MDDRTTTNFTKTRPGEKPAEKPAERPGKAAVAPKRRWRLGLLLVVALAIGVGLWLYTHPATQAPSRRDFANAPIPVEAMQAATGDIDLTVNALGTVTSLATVTIVSQISGYLVSVVSYTEGQTVKKRAIPWPRSICAPMSLPWPRRRVRSSATMGRCCRPPSLTSSATRTW